MFNAFDIVCITIVLVFAALGFRTGIIATLIYIASGFIGMWAAHHHAEQLGLGFYAAFIFIVVMVIAGGYFLSKVLHALMFGKWDMIIGSLMGVVLGTMLTVSVVVPLTIKMPVSVQILVARSFASAHLMPTILRTIPLLDYVKLERLEKSIQGKPVDEAKELIESGKEAAEKIIKDVK